MHVTCNAVSLDQLGAKSCTWETFRKHGSCFCLTVKTHSGLLTNYSLSCSWNNSYCAFGPTISASTNIMCNCATSLNSPHKRQSNSSLSPSFFKTPTAALPPPSRALGVSPSLQLHQPTGTFPTHQLPHSWRSLRQQQPLLTKRRQHCLDWGLVQSKWVGQTLLQCWRWRPWDDRCPHWMTNFRGRDQLLEAPTTAIISSSWMMVRWPEDIIEPTTFFSTSVLKKNSCSPAMLRTNPPRPL